MAQDLAQATAAEAAKSDTSMRLATVASVSSSGGVMISINGATVGPAACVSSYVPTVGDNVAVIRQGASWLVLGISGSPTVSSAAGSLALLVSWTASLNHVSRVALGNRAAGMIVAILTPGTKTDGTTVATLPSFARPKSSFDLPAVSNAIPAGGQAPHFGITPGGSVTCWGFTTATYASVTAVFPLDV